MSQLKLIVIDVDGTMTDGGIYYDENGNELKKFCTKDAAGFFAIQWIGVEIMVLTGRECSATARRMSELKVDYLYQNVKDKLSFLKNFMKDNGITKEEIAYLGDDLNDFQPMQLVGYIGCPEDACEEIKKIANYVSSFKGGYGAVRDIIEHYLRETGEWENAIKSVYGMGI